MTIPPLLSHKPHLASAKHCHVYIVMSVHNPLILFFRFYDKDPFFKMNCDALDTHNANPTNFHISVDDHDLAFYCSRLLQDSPSLFVSESSACCVEVRQHIPTNTTNQPASCDKFCTKSTVVVTSLDELRSTLDVSSPICHDKRT